SECRGRVLEHPKDVPPRAGPDRDANLARHPFDRSQMPAAKLAPLKARIAPTHQLASAAGLAISRKQAVRDVTSQAADLVALAARPATGWWMQGHTSAPNCRRVCEDAMRRSVQAR